MAARAPEPQTSGLGIAGPLFLAGAVAAAWLVSSLRPWALRRDLDELLARARATVRIEAIGEHPASRSAWCAFDAEPEAVAALAVGLGLTPVVDPPDGRDVLASVPGVRHALAVVPLKKPARHARRSTGDPVRLEGGARLDSVIVLYEWATRRGLLVLGYAPD